MKLSSKDYARFLALSKKKDLTSEEKAELDALTAKRNERGSNDPKWWLKYPVLAKDATNVAFNVIPGTYQSVSDNGTGIPMELDIGVIAKADVKPTIGRSVSDKDGFNVQVRQLWLDMHRKYRGIGTYEKADLGIALVAINSAFTTLAKFERIYGVINSYQINNRVVPYGLLEALEIDKSIESNMADFRYLLNLYAMKMQQFCLPKGLAVLESDTILLSNIFKDAKSDRASLIVFDTPVFGVYNPTRFTSGGCVDFIQFEAKMSGNTPAGNSGFLLQDIEGILNDVVNALLSDDDIARMCSDLIAAYGPENVHTMASMPTDYKVIPVCDYERSLQFHNLTRSGKVLGEYYPGLEVAPGTPVDATYIQNMYSGNFIDYCIYQFDNTVICKLSSNIDEQSYKSLGGVIQMANGAGQVTEQGKAREVLFDCWTDTPTSDDILIGTRFTALVSPLVTYLADRVQELECFGTMVCERVHIYNYDNASDAYNDDTLNASVNDSTVVPYLTEAKLNQVDWRPLTYVFHSGHVTVIGDLDNYTRISAENLRRIHEVCVLSGFKFDQVSRE